ncbi:MAG: hypothetical protein H0W21_04175, partial [Actinobacteria bacterium]|nr:hypothetical protein [Actinomycetota bacterium]
YRAGSSALGWAPELGAPANLARYGAFYLATSAWWDAYGAVGNAVLVSVLGRPLLAALDRAARRMSFTTGAGRAGRNAPVTQSLRGSMNRSSGNRAKSRSVV